MDPGQKRENLHVLSLHGTAWVMPIEFYPVCTCECMNKSVCIFFPVYFILAFRFRDPINSQ